MPDDIRLRQVTEADLPILFEHQLDPIACAMAAFRPRDREAFLAHWAKILADTNVVTRTILREGQVVGSIVSFDRSGKRQVGYWIDRDHWGKGIATAALSQFLVLEPMRPLFAYVAVTNVGSLRVLEKCGFTIIGREMSPPDSHGEEIEEVLLQLTGEASIQRSR